MIEGWLPKIEDVEEMKIILSLNVRNLAMSRKLYDGYEYVDSDEQYTYPNSSVLINKFEIKNQDVAHEKEYHLARNRGLDLFLSYLGSLNERCSSHP
jgi:cell filamentation protein